MQFLHPLIRKQRKQRQTADPIAVLPAAKPREARISAENAKQSADNLPQKQQKTAETPPEPLCAPAGDR
jgi:hypothetical protein